MTSAHVENTCEGQNSTYDGQEEYNTAYDENHTTMTAVYLVISTNTHIFVSLHSLHAFHLVGFSHPLYKTKKNRYNTSAELT